MKRKSLISFLAITLGSSSIAAVPAQAQYGGWSNAYGSNYGDTYGRGHDDRNYGGRDYDRRDQRGYRCSKGTTGTIVGAAAGGLLGSQIAGRRGDRTMATIIGAGLGAVAGRAIDRSGNRNRC